MMDKLMSDVHVLYLNDFCSMGYQSTLLQESQLLMIWLVMLQTQCDLTESTTIEWNIDILPSDVVWHYLGGE